MSKADVGRYEVFQTLMATLLLSLRTLYILAAEMAHPIDINDGALDCDDPIGPIPWSVKGLERFDVRAKSLL